MKKNKPTNTTENILRIQDADQLKELLGQTFDVQFNFGSRRIAVAVTALSDSTADAVRTLRRKARPPWKKDLGASGDYDYLDEKYLADRELNERKARALIIYSHCPIVCAKKPGLTGTEAIYQHVQGFFPENVLELLSARISSGDMSLEEQVNFTSTPGSAS